MRTILIILFLALSAFGQTTVCQTASTTATASSGASSLTVASASGIFLTQQVNGAGIVPGSTVTAISGTTITLSAPTMAALSATPVTFGCVGNITQNSARFVVPISYVMASPQEGWAHIGISRQTGGPYTDIVLHDYCTQSPEIVISGSGGSGAFAYFDVNGTNGVFSGPRVYYSGTGYPTSGNTAVGVDRCTWQYGIVSASWSGGTATIETDPKWSGSDDFFYHSPFTGTISGVTPSGYNASNVTVTWVNTNTYTYPLASNPGSYVSGGQLADNPGSGMTFSSVTTDGAGHVTGLTESATGSGYHFAIPSGNVYGGVAQTIAMGTTALAPATTYYVQACLRPDENDTTGQSCGNEFTFTTPAACPGGVCIPALPYSTWLPQNGTSGGYPTLATTSCGSLCYTVVPIAYNSTDGECEATASVGPVSYVYSGSGPSPAPSGVGSVTSWSVTLGDKFQNILNEVGYGAILDIAEGSPCAIPNVAHYCNSTGNLSGLFAYQLCPLDIDPAASSIDDPNHRYIVIRTHQNNPTDLPPFGMRVATGNSTWTANIASFVSSNPTGTGGASGPEHFYTKAYQSSTPSVGYNAHHWLLQNIQLKTSGTGNFGSFIVLGNGEGDAAQKQFPPSYTILDRVWFNPPLRDTTHMSYGGIYGSPGGHFAMLNSVMAIFDSNDKATSITFGDCTGGPIDLENNLFMGLFENVYFESNGVPNCNGGGAGGLGSLPTSQATQVPTRIQNNLTMTHNDGYWPLSSCSSCSQWDGLSRIPFRQNLLESKMLQYALIQGNVCDGQWAQQTPGECIAPTPQGTTSINFTGVHDITVQFNLFAHVSSIMSLSGLRTYTNGGPPEGAPSNNILVFNNYGHNIGYLPYESGFPGGGAGYFTESYAGANYSFISNTFGQSNNNAGTYISTWHQTYSGGSLFSGFTWKSNNIALDQGGAPNGSIYASWNFHCCSISTPAPLVTGTSGGSNQNNSALVFSSAFPQLKSTGLTNVLNWGGNIVTPSLYNGSDMTDTQAAGIAANNPTGDTYITTSSSQTRANHLLAAGCTGLDTGDPRCVPTPQNPVAAGVNPMALEAYLGIVSQIAVLAGPNALQFTYLAPDTRSCSVDINNTRTNDGGGARQRTVTITGLSASTAYPYIISCYYSQSAPSTPNWPFAAWDSSNQATEGTAITTATGTRTLPVSFTALTGETSRTLTLTPIGGSSLSPVTCVSSPCNISLVPNGAYNIAYVVKNVATVIANGSYLGQ